jgi:hypothetical protein
MPEHNLALLKYTFSSKVGMGSILDIKWTAVVVWLSFVNNGAFNVCKTLVNFVFSQQLEYDSCKLREILVQGKEY